MGGIKKFIRIKFDLASHFNIEVFHSDETLKNDYTLMDVAYLYAWRRVNIVVSLLFRQMLFDVMSLPISRLPKR